MRTFKPLYLLPLLAACELPPQLDEDGNPILPPLPPQVQAAMPEGMPRTFVFEAANRLKSSGRIANMGKPNPMKTAAKSPKARPISVTASAENPARAIPAPATFNGGSIHLRM